MRKNAGYVAGLALSAMSLVGCVQRPSSCEIEYALPGHYPRILENIGDPNKDGRDDFRVTNTRGESFYFLSDGGEKYTTLREIQKKEFEEQRARHSEERRYLENFRK